VADVIIETDVVAIDARISTQLDAIEEAIRNTSTLNQNTGSMIRYLKQS
jgi:flagellar biosynthesis/type III secretory pathway protein FliH